MRTKKQWLEYKQLEQIPFTIADSELEARSEHTSRLSRWLERIWRPITQLLESPTDPQIWTTYDSMGNPIWHAHDPLTGKDSEWICEDDLRVWLEERYYQPTEKPLLTTLEQR